jgi:hypothetical protein
MNGFARECRKAAKQGFSMYFLPLLGFVSGIKQAWEKMEMLGKPDGNAASDCEHDCRRGNDRPRPPGVNP